MRKLVLRAGPEAYQKIKKDGFSLDLIKGVVSAAGGPKWFTTYGLTKYIIADLIAPIEHELHFLGASVGSWQMTAALTSDPGAAIDRLQNKYCSTLYSPDPGESEISKACELIISEMLSEEYSYILNHPNRRLHIVTSRGRGLLGSKKKILKGLGFAYSFTANAINRRYVNSTTERVIFTTGGEVPYHIDQDILTTTTTSLNRENLLLALRASGSIPFVMESISNIPDAPQGTYWDGGITDYHIALPYATDGIILHPHFLPYVLPGWLDKKIPWNRKAQPELMSKVLLISPSEQYINSLPLKQISDMKDFYHFGQDQQARINYWSEISKRSLELGQELKELVFSGKIADEILPYTT